MFKKVIVVLSTFAVALLLFALYQWHEETPTDTARLGPPTLAPVETRPAPEEPTFKFRDVQVPPGEKPSVVVYDDRGIPKISVGMEKWHPVAENEWHMTRPEVRLLLPAGQIVHVTADEGQIVVAKEEDDNYDPKRGWLRGHVHIVIDRTDERWRKENPDRAAPDQHREYLVHLWLDDVKFDLDLARLSSLGSIRVESYDATVEGTGLVMAWNEVDRRIELLEIARGRRMELRRDAGLVEFSMPGGERTERISAAAVRAARATASAPAEVEAPLVSVESEAVSPPAASTQPIEKLTRDLFLDVTREQRFRRRRNQIDTYKAVLEGRVAVRQKRGELDIGSLAANTLELLFDFGQEQREVAQAAPAPDPQGAGGPSRGQAVTRPAAEPSDRPLIEVAWSGKLTMTPQAVEPGAAAGRRFHAIASGDVQLAKGESRASCDKLVFHNETQQAWLTGIPVRLSEKTREMSGREIFYDRRAGIARISGPGTMSETRDPAGAIDRGRADAGALSAEEPGAAPAAERVVVRWNEGVDLAFAVIRRPQFDPKTSQVVIREQDSLRHAVFRGGVEMIRVNRSLRGDEVELFFAEAARTDQPATEFARAIAGLLTTDPELQRTLETQIAVGVAGLAAARPDDRPAVAEQLAAFLADISPVPAEDRPALRSDLRDAIAAVASAPPSQRAAAASGLAAILARVAPPEAQEEAARRLTAALAGLSPRPPGENTDPAGELEKMIARRSVRFASHEKLLFTAPEQWSAELDRGRLPTALSERFRNHRMPLPTGTSVVIREAGQTWQITAGRRSFTVDRTADGLNVYRDDVVTADELVVTMATDPNGRPVPVRAEARGNVSATQATSEGQQFIAAEDRLSVEWASVPAPAEPLDRTAAAARARAHGIDPRTIDWEALERRRRERRELAIVYLEAFGGVRAAAPAEGLESLIAEELRCWTPDGRQIERATLAGTAERPAEVELAEYYVRGPSIQVDARRQYAEVPAAGLLRFRSYEDLNGERLDEPVPVTVSWTGHMVMNGQHNLGVFTGDVHAVSRDSVLDCRELRIRFADAPAPATTSAPAERFWIFEPLMERIAGGPEAGRAGGLGRAGRISKRAVHFLAIGEARALSTTVDPADRARILSRMQIDGPEIAVDVEADHLAVNGPGHLLIEDYRLPLEKKPRPAAPAARDPFGSNLEVASPSQTLFTWQNAMSYFAGRNLAVLDGDVTMAHRSGSEIKLALELAQAMKIDVQEVRKAKGRRAGLRCDNLIVEFLRDRSARRRGDPTPLAGATELRQLRATGHARLEEGTRSVEGQLITYNRAANVIRVFGSDDAPAQLLDQDEAAGRLWRWWGDAVTYNLQTGEIEADGSVVLATGKQAQP